MSLEQTYAELRAENERLKAAVERMMIGGNHIALYKTDQWPEPGTDHMVALEKIGAGQSYDMWCCWNAIMCARRILENKPFFECPDCGKDVADSKTGHANNCPHALEQKGDEC